jgi:outer membrane lipoprotein-sorting protein
MKDNQQIVPELSYLSDGATFALSPDITTDDAGNDSYVVTVTVRDGQTVVIFYDVKTGYRVKAETHNGAQVSAVVESGDYRDVNGIKFPYSLKNFIGGQELNFKVTDLKVNSGLSDEEFK